MPEQSRSCGERQPPGYAIGIDLGGTKIAAGLVGLDDGRVLARRLQPTAPERGGEAVLHDVLAMAQALAADAAALGCALNAIGLGVPELVDGQGRVLSGETIRWQQLDISMRLTDATRLPTFVEADVRAAARAEGRWGAAVAHDPFVYVTIGTGISCCLMVNQTPFLGARGMTGSCGSGRCLIPTDDGLVAGGPPLEQFAAGPALVRRFAQRMPGFKGTAVEVIAAAQAGNAQALEVVMTGGAASGAAIAQLVNILDPAVVVIGGGLGLCLGMYRDALLETARRQIWSDLHRELPIVSAALGTDAGWIGAALAAAQQQGIIHG